MVACKGFTGVHLNCGGVVEFFSDLCVCCLSDLEFGCVQTVFGNAENINVMGVLIVAYNVERACRGMINLEAIHVLKADACCVVLCCLSDMSVSPCQIRLSLLFIGFENKQPFGGLKWDI